MKLTELAIGDISKILHIHAESALRNRLNALGILRGETLNIKRHSMGKQTIEIEINSSLIALRRDEAEKIEVEKLDYE
jgi:ferrous iron transport protein A